MMRQRNPETAIIQRTDANKDGKVTADKYRSLFTEMDLDENKIVTADEISQGRQSGLLARLDADKDGAISEKAYLTTFESLDADGNGIVGTDEMSQASGMRERHKGRK